MKRGGDVPRVNEQTPRGRREVVSDSSDITSDSTCWIVVNGAASGDNEARREFAERYLPVVRTYLGARWRTSPLIDEIEDAVQEVFLDMFKAHGALDRLEPGRPGGFRAYLYGVARVVALRCETRSARRRDQTTSDDLAIGALPADEPELAEAFDRALSVSLLDQAVRRHKELAKFRGERGRRQVELLRMRFWEDLPIREIARRWNEEAPKLHKEYARARKSFKRALQGVIADHNPGAIGATERECERLLATIP